MASRGLVINVGAGVVALALMIASGVIGAETAPPTRVAVLGDMTVAGAETLAVPATGTPSVAASPTPATTSAAASAPPVAASAAASARSPTPAAAPAPPAVPATPISDAERPLPSPTPDTNEPPAKGPTERQTAAAPVLQHSVRGVVVSVQGAQFVVRLATGGRATVEANAATLVSEDRRQATMAAVRPGCAIVVVGSPVGNGALMAQAMLVSPPPDSGLRGPQPYPPRGHFNGRG